MDMRLGRSIAIIVVILALSLMTLRYRARQLRGGSSAPAAHAAPSSPTSLPVAPRPDPDSTAAVATAVRALAADDSAHGWGSVPMQVLKFERDSAEGGAVLITLLPTDPMVPGGGVLVKVTSDGRARLVERYQ